MLRKFQPKITSGGTQSEKLLPKHDRLHRWNRSGPRRHLPRGHARPGSLLPGHARLPQERRLHPPRTDQPRGHGSALPRNGRAQHAVRGPRSVHRLFRRDRPGG